jgi:ATP-binding cassette subfamily F protein 3
MLLATLDAPHLVILDEPTNHLDIESREALVRALMDYDGAVILVSHDPHLVGMVADRLWLVKDGSVTPFTEDLDAYQKLLLTERGGGGVAAESKQKPKAKHKLSPGHRKAMAPLQAEVIKCEARVTKLEELKSKIEKRLIDPDLYEPVNRDKLRLLQGKAREINDGLVRGEELWMEAVEELEAAKSQ